ncbi:MAG: DNA polymerase III subunit alpha [Gammaproteobacteria bacterium]|nr:DNA polymerase III subunit alpha [Gammaproteobacteria bacterium]MAY03169.1 DNA polymerase III subunit alpha [Gammaproteobacteria bacterium]|tara:strand:- start:146500 stop:150024 length:3525 start_codon:yes stop_codon:yes gene_type:complete
MSESPAFIHLKVHSEYSLADGLVRIPELVRKTAELKQPAVALTDLANFYGLIKFYSAAIASGIKPLCGCDLNVCDEEADDRYYPITILIKNNLGYQNLIRIISKSYQEGQLRGKILTRRQWLEEFNAGLIVLSGGRLGSIGQALLNQDEILAKAELQYWMKLFPDSFYLELQRTERPGEEQYIHAAVELATQFSCPVVASNDVRFLSVEEFEAHEARVCINDRRTLDDPRRPRNYSETQFLRSTEEMQELFRDIPEALQNTVEIAKRCNLELSLGTPRLPEYPVPEGMGVDDYLRKLSEDGLRARLASLGVDKNDTETHQRYQERLDFELDIINQMGFPGYFLIVMEFIQWAKDNGVPVGPGRGSGAGSLVAYALLITDLDPLAYDLLFERFLNPERISMPDFDVDFCMDGRDRVIDHVADLYGRDAVSQIITFGTMAAKGVIRDVARVQGKSYALADKLSKLVPFELGMTLEKAMNEEPQLAEFVANDEEAEEIMEMAFKLEGIVRNVGKHAGGVVIAPGKLTDFTPLYCDETGANLVTQYDMSDVEKAGLVKFDFLGLRTLTIINWAVEMINAEQGNTAGSDDLLDITKIPLNDSDVYQLLVRGETTAVFQLESKGMKELIKRLKPNTFEDIIALVALYRPGPLGSGMVDDFINRKHGAEVHYPHPLVEPILKNTYGVILYQEQVMQIAQVLANYSLGGADVLRRAMGKKKPEEMQKQREIFMVGATKNNIDPKQAEYIFELMEKFAGYGFNKSHSAAYALVSYQTAWLKYHYPAHFMASVLSADMQNTDKIVILADECRRMELPLLAPDVNIGHYRFTVDYEDEKPQVIYGLGAIKGLGSGPIENIIATREASGSFKNLYDFCQRVDLGIINKRSIEALIRAGAFDSISRNTDRAILLASMTEAVKTAEQTARIQASGVEDLFGNLMPSEESDEDVYQAFRHIRPWSEQRRLQEEKESLGLYLSGHPIEEYLPEISRMTSRRIVNLRAENSPQTVIGLIHDMRVIKSKRGGNIAILTLDDQSARIEVSLFGEVYENVRETLSKDAIVMVEGQVSLNEFAGDGSLQIRGKRIISFQEARESSLNNITLHLAQDAIEEQDLLQLEDILQDYVYVPAAGNAPQGKTACNVVVNYARGDVKGKIALGKSWRVRPDDDLLHRLREHYGEQGVSLSY